MNCNNCNAKLSCGCQKKRASNGVSCCSSCLSFYEKGLQSQTPNAPVTNTVNKNVWNSNKYIANK